MGKLLEHWDHFVVYNLDFVGTMGLMLEILVRINRKEPKMPKKIRLEYYTCTELKKHNTRERSTSVANNLKDRLDGHSSRLYNLEVEIRKILVELCELTSEVKEIKRGKRNQKTTSTHEESGT